MQVEFWHGNCSTFELVSKESVQQMYEANLMTIGNFYTGEFDRHHISCTDRSLSMRRKRKMGDIITLCLLVFVVFIMCFIGFYYGRIG